MHWMFLPLRRYFDFFGRSRRLEFWLFYLFTFIVSIVFQIVFAGALFGPIMRAMQLQQQQMQAGGFDDDRGGGFGDAGSAGDIPPEQAFGEVFGVTGGIGIVLGLIWVLWNLFILIPSIAVTIRRLHDTDRTGWWMVLPLAPYLVGIVALLGFAISPDLGAVGVVVFFVAILAALVLGLVLLVFMFIDGTPGPNRFGANPKGSDYAQTFA